MSLSLHQPAPLSASEINALLADPESPLAKDLTIARQALARLSAAEKEAFLLQSMKQTQIRRKADHDYINFAMRKDAREERNAAEWQQALASKPKVQQLLLAAGETHLQRILKALLLGLESLAQVEREYSQLQAERMQLQAAWVAMRQNYANDVMDHIFNRTFVLPNGQVLQFDPANPQIAQLRNGVNARLANRRNVQDILEHVPHVREQHEARVQQLQQAQAANRLTLQPGTKLPPEEEAEVRYKANRKVCDEMNLNDTRQKMLDALTLVPLFRENLKRKFGENYKELFKHHPRGFYGAINDYIKSTLDEVDQKENIQMLNAYRAKEEYNNKKYSELSAEITDKLFKNYISNTYKLHNLTEQRGKLEDLLNTMYLLKTENKVDDEKLQHFLIDTFGNEEWRAMERIRVNANI
jgi:hypothetical protein